MITTEQIEALRPEVEHHIIGLQDFIRELKIYSFRLYAANSWRVIEGDLPETTGILTVKLNLPDPTSSIELLADIVISQWISQRNAALEPAIDPANEPEESNAQYCYQCGDEVSENSQYYCVDDEMRCGDCSFTCAGCGKTQSIDAYHSEGYCNCCAPEVEDSESNNDLHPNDINPMHQYDYSTKLSEYPVFKEAHENTVAMGIELEMSFPSSLDSNIRKTTYEYLIKACSYLWKYDGSIEGHGGELVTLPVTLQRLRRANLRELLARLKAHGALAYNSNCGIHVHLSRDLLTCAQWRNIEHFFWSAQDQIGAFSKRSNFNYCQFYPPGKQADRYAAINLRNNDTVELRVFRGTMNYARLHASLQFSNSMIDFARLHGRAGMNWKVYCLYLKQEPRYQKLVKYLMSQGLFICV